MHLKKYNISLETRLENKLAFNYWVNKIKLLSVVNDRPLSILETEEIVIPNDDLSYFNKLARNNDTVEFTVLLSIYNVLLQRYFQSASFIASSGFLEKEETLLYRFNFINSNTFKQCLSETKEEIQEVLKYSNFEESTITQISFVAYTPYGFSFNGNYHSKKNNFPFYLNINNKENGLTISIRYDKEFTSDYIANHFLGNVKAWLLNLENCIENNVSKLQIISEDERKEVLYSFNNTHVNYPKDKTIVDLFEEQVKKAPNNIAVVFEDKELTYKEFNEQANQLARYIRETYAIQSDDLIGVKLDRSEQMLIAIFGILKSGAAYVPIDVNYPQERIDYIKEDSSCKVVIDEHELERFRAVKDNYSFENLQKRSKPNHLIYVIYTSGTTGNPKGVLNHHAALHNRLLWKESYLNVQDNDVFFQKTPYSFDVSAWELLLPFITGARLVVAKPEGHKDPSYLEKLINEKKVTIIHFVPSMLDAFLMNLSDGSCDSLSHIICSGEALSPNSANLCKQKLLKSSLHNLYGPTEAAIDVTAIDLSNVDVIEEGVSIGKPIWNTKIYIVDKMNQLVPIGVSGELLISGVQVANGYLNLPSLTNERFISDPFRTQNRVYRTGDIVQWLPDGAIKYIGRNDNQVKVRGFRIELGEIENAISQISKIQQAVVLTKETNHGKILVAYYVSKGAIDKSEIHAYLQNKLANYMVPSVYVALDALPLTSNGKVDRKALPNVVGKDLIKNEYVAPRNKTEEALVEIWQEVLGVERVGIIDNFFELGGHSLQVGQIISRINKQLNKGVSFKAFFEHPIIQKLSQGLSNNVYNAIPQIEARSYYPLTTSQNRLWILSQLEGGDLAYNMPGAVTLKGDLDVSKFEETFKDLIKRHEILRTNFIVNESGEIHQYITQEDAFEFSLLENDVSNQTKQDIEQLLLEEHATAFDLANGLLLRAKLYKAGEQEYIFSLTMHHIIGDGWSMELLISEVISTYNNLVQNNEYNIPKLDIQYKDYAVWLKSELTKEHYKTSEKYWLSQFQGELPILDLPSFKNRPKVQTYNGNTLTHNFSASFLEKLKTFSKSKDATLFMTLMSGINALMYRYTNQNDIILGTPIAGRDHPDLEGQIGLYLNTLAIRTKIEESNCFLDVLEDQKQNLLSAYEHQNYPFDELVNKLTLKRDTSRSALFDVMVVLQNQEQLNSIGTDKDLDGIQIEDYEINRSTSQFDLSFTFVEKEGIELSLEYNTDIYDKFFIESIFAHYENLMCRAIDNPKGSILSIDYTTEKEKKQLLEVYNNSTIEYPKEKTIVDIFENQVKETSGNIAIIFEDRQLTYLELDEQANQLALYIRETYAIQADDLIGIKLERSEQLLVVILGILKSGAAYVPVDVNYPEERINYIEKDSNCKVVIDQKELEHFLTVKTKYSKASLPKITKPNHLAYVIYTSGTTGNPKGVMVEHRNVVSIYSDWKEQYELDQFEVCLLQLASVSFDVFVGDICRALLNGGTMVIPSDTTRLNPKDLYELMEKHKVSLFEGTPGLVLPLLNYIKENNKNYGFLKLIIFGSDSFNNQTFNSVRDTFGSSIRIINSYGVTEATIDSTYYDDYYSDFLGTTPIGKPFSNTKVYILNEKKQLVSTGVFGMIYIGGAGVSRGYYNKPELTTSKFIKIPYQDENVYSTGDLARWLPDGNIEFLGRSDFQIKLRGYRIELGEIETVIKQYSEEIENVVVAVKEIDQEKVLVSYYISTEIIDKSGLREFLKKKFPEYMIPSFYLQLSSFALTSNGKVNRDALPNVSGEDGIRKKYIAPSDETELELVAIWEEVLGIEKIGVTDDFFELGGHSLKIVKLKNSIYQVFDIEISFNDLFICNTIKEQSLKIVGIQVINQNNIENNVETEFEIFSV